MQIALIAAMDNRRLIGAGGHLPWRLPADLRWFKQVTMGKPMVMGRRTYESIGRPLPGRHSIVLTRSQDYMAQGCTVVHSVEEALEAAGPVAEVMVIGGAQVFRLFMPWATRLYLTLVDAALEGDTYFPVLDEAAWHETWSRERPADEANPYGLRFAIWEKLAPGQD